jgi:hypothetical protein
VFLSSEGRKRTLAWHILYQSNLRLYEREKLLPVIFEIPAGCVQCLTPVMPPAQKAEVKRTANQGQPGEKVSETPISTNKSWVWWHASVIPAT